MTPIYLDHHATTPLDPRVLAKMLPHFTESFGNPHSADHAYGWAAEEAIEAARRQVAALIAAPVAGLVFTSGATEANNLALFGLAEHLGATGRRHLLVSPLEHASVAGPMRELARRGFAVETLPVEPDGRVRAEAVAARLRPETGLVSVMAANHEIGTLQPLAEIGDLLRGTGTFFHSDATQAAGWVGLDVERLGLHLVTLSAHKLCGPMGAGALCLDPALRKLLRPLNHGGGQEQGLRPGTLPVPLCVGFGAAAELAMRERAEAGRRVAALRGRLLDGLRAGGLPLVVNGALDCRLPGNLNFYVPGRDSEPVLAALRDRVAVSAGSACQSGARDPSPVLTALGRNAEEARAALRIGIGRSTRADEIESAITAILAAYR